MEEHFLSQYVSGEQKFLPKPWYNLHGDCIIYKTTNEAVVSNRIDEILTIYESLKTKEPVGFKIKGIRGMIGKFGFDGLVVKSEQEGTTVRAVSVAALLLAAYETGPMNIKRRQAYAGVLTPRRQDFGIPIEALSPC